MTQPRPAWMGRVQLVLQQRGHAYFEEFRPPPRGGRQSAVLMLFGPAEGGGQDVVLTERAHHMRSHPAQVSFPGGAVEPHDESASHAALREAEEEVGIAPASVEVVAELPQLYLRPSRFVVTPVLGWWAEPSGFGRIDTREVHRAVRAPLDHLVDPAARFTVTHPSGFVGPGFDFDGLFVWGFTAKLLSEVLVLAGLERPWDTSVERPLPRRFLPGGRNDGLAQSASDEQVPVGEPASSTDGRGAS